MNILNLKQGNGMPVIATFNIEFPQIFLTIRKCRLMQKKDGGLWVALPAEGYEKDGQKKYFNLVIIAKEKQEDFERAIITKIDLLMPKKPPVKLPGMPLHDEECPF